MLILHDYHDWRLIDNILNNKSKQQFKIIIKTNLIVARWGRDEPSRYLVFKGSLLTLHYSELGVEEISSVTSHGSWLELRPQVSPIHLVRTHIPTEPR